MSGNILCNKLTVREPLTNVTLDGVVINNVQLNSAGATDGYVLTSDGSGNATWEALPVSGAPTFADGLVTTPSIAFTDDSNTGIYRVGDGQIGFSSNGTKTFEINSTGASVSGKTVTTTLQVTSGASNGYILTSDGSGNATWTAPSTGDNVITNLDFGDNSGSGITATGDGSLTHGDTTDTSTILASGAGAHAHGVTSGTSSSMTASGNGASSRGIATNGSSILASHPGSMCGGAFYDGSTCQTTQDGAFAWGLGYLGSTVQATNYGAVCMGRAFSGTMTASGEGTLLTGKADSGSMTVSGVASAGHLYSGSGETSSIVADAALGVGRAITLSAANDYSLMVGAFGTSLTGGGNPLGEDTHQIQIASGANSGDPDVCIVLGADTLGAGSQGKGFANAWESTGADYAEFFEWEDGNVDDEERIGFFVKLTGDGHIVKASDVDAAAGHVLGIVTSTQSHTAFIADGHALKWQGACLRDDFGRTLIELVYKQPALDVLRSHYTSLPTPSVPPQELVDSIEAKEDTDETIVDLLDEALRDQVRPIRRGKVSPEYDREAEYVRRNERPEWDPVSLLGKVYVRDDGTCVVGQRCTCNADGIATPGADWFVMERKSANVIRVFFK